MMKLLRHGGRTICVVALLAALSLGCSATRTARVAQKSPVEGVSAKPAASTEESVSGRSSLTSTAPSVAQHHLTHTDRRDRCP